MKRFKHIFSAILAVILINLTTEVAAQDFSRDKDSDISVQNSRVNEEATAWLDSVDISLLTCGPGQEVWSYYGHTALRIQNKAMGTDVAVNWGMFSFNQSCFVLRFVFGLTDYQYNEERLVIGKKRIGELLGMIDELKAKDMFELKDIYEVRERLIVCQTLIEHLRARKETRWHSFGENTDYPEESNQWLKYVNSKRKPDGGTEIIFRELVTGGKVYECTDFTE